MEYVLSGAILIAYFAEMYNDYIKIFEEKLKSREKRKYILRALVMFVLAFSALILVYHSLGMHGIDLKYLLRYGKLR